MQPRPRIIRIVALITRVMGRKSRASVFAGAFDECMYGVFCDSIGKLRQAVWQVALKKHKMISIVD